MTNIPVEALVGVLALAFAMLLLANSMVVGISRIFDAWVIGGIELIEIVNDQVRLVQKLEPSYVVARPVRKPVTPTPLSVDRTDPR